jgi:Holliday junction resolvase
MIKMTAQNLWNFIVKFGSKAEICWKLEELKWIFLNNSEVSSYLLGHILLFWKVTMQTIE